MTKKIKVLFLISTLIILLVGLGTISAESSDNHYTVDDSMIDVDSKNSEQADLINLEKQTFVNNVKEASSASDYSELKSYVNGATDAETEINLEDKTYEVDEPLVWGTDETAKTLTINGNGATIDGSNNQQFLTVNEGYTVNINNLIIQNTVAEKGAAVINYGTLNINNVTFKDNNAAKKGGAIYSEGTLNIEGNSHFIGNHVTNGVNGDGGAAIFTKSAIYVKDTEFDSNIAEYTDSSSSSNGGNGGAISVEDSISDMIIVNSTFTNNKGRHGGAINIHDEQGRNQGTKKITGSKFSGNQAIYGGAIEVYNDLIIEDSEFNDNKVYGVGSSNLNPLGGAICVNDLVSSGLPGSLIVNNTSFTGNTAPQTSVSGITNVGFGGAIYNSGPDAIFDNCTFTQNIANKGGAYYFHNTTRNLVRSATFNNSKFIENVAYTTNTGAAIHDYHYGSTSGNPGSKLTIENCFFEENNPTSTAGYGIYTYYDNLTISNTNITGLRPIYQAGAGSGNYVHNLSVNGLNNVTGINTFNLEVSPTNYEELVIVSKEINNQYDNRYASSAQVHIYLEGTEYIETEPIVFDNLNCQLILYGKAKTIDANGQQFLTMGEGKTITINNVTIANAKAEKGAAIINYGKVTAQNNVVFENNEALYYGGAIYSTGDLTVRGTNFTNNKVSTVSEATINDYGGAAICSLGKLTVNRTNFIENIAAHNDVEDGDGGFGGAISILNTTQAVAIDLSNFTENSARHGGAIAIKNNDKINSNKVSITRNNFDENTALLGGAINTYQQINITNNNFTKNTVKGEVSSGEKSKGGAIILNEGNSPYTANVINNTFKENEAQGGESGVIHTKEGTTLNSSNNKYLNNKAANTAVASNEGKATFTGDTFTGNAANFTGVFTNYGELTVADCTFENNDGKGYGDLVYLYNDLTITGSTINSDNLEELIAGEGNVVATNNIVNEETLPERLIKTTLTITPKNTLAFDEYNLVTATLIDATDIPVEGKEVNVIINGEMVDSNVTDENGVVSYYYKPTEGSSSSIKFTFTPDDYYIGSESEEKEFEFVVREETVIEYVLVNDIEGKVVLDIRVYEKESEDLIVNAKVDLSGDITATNVRTNKLYKDTELEAGEHTITVTYNGLEDYYRPCTTDITFTVIEDPSNIIENLQEELDKLNQTFNQTVTELQNKLDEANEKINNLTQNLTEAQNRIDELEGNVSALVGALADANDMISELEGNVSALVGALADANDMISELEGNVSALVGALADANDRIDELEALIASLHAPENTVLTIDPVTDAKYRDNITISGLLITNDGLALNNQIVTVTINGVSQNVTTVLGKYEYEINAIIVGENEITVTYEGNDKYKSSENSSTFNVDRKESTIIINDIDTVTCYDDVTITGEITSVNGIALRHVNLKVYLNGEEQLVLTDYAGKFRATFTTTTVGEQLVRVVYKGNTKYVESEANTTFTTSNVRLVMYTIKPVTYRDEYVVRGKLTDYEGNAIADAEIQLTVNGETVNVTTDANGKYVYKAKALELGQFKVTATYSGEEETSQAEVSKTLTVTKREVSLVLNEIDECKVGTETTISGLLTDDIGTPYKNCNIYVKINGEEQHIYTDNKGTFSCTYTPTTAGTQDVIVTYKGNSNYLGDQVTTTFEATA